MKKSVRLLIAMLVLSIAASACSKKGGGKAPMSPKTKPAATVEEGGGEVDDEEENKKGEKDGDDDEKNKKGEKDKSDSEKNKKGEKDFVKAQNDETDLGDEASDDGVQQKRRNAQEQDECLKTDGIPKADSKVEDKCKEGTKKKQSSNSGVQFDSDDVSYGEAEDSVGDSDAGFFETNSRPSRSRYIEPQILTGAGSHDKYLFTDAKNDAVMYQFVSIINALDEQARADSISLAVRIRSVEMNSDIYERGANGNIMKLKVVIEDGGRLIEARFEGSLDADRKAVLRQIAGQDYGYQFEASMMCLDADTLSCQNIAIGLNHMSEGKICKRTFIVYRHGDAAVYMTKTDYELNGVVPVPAYNDFAEYLVNTVDWTHNRSKQPPLPRAAKLRFKTWAVAKGPAHFDITFTAANYYGQKQNRDEKTTFAGDLVTREGSTELIYQVGVSGGHYAQQMDSAYLTGNDGRGHLGLQIWFRGPNHRPEIGEPAARINLEFETRVREIGDLENNLK